MHLCGDLVNLLDDPPEGLPGQQVALEATGDPLDRWVRRCRACLGSPPGPLAKSCQGLAWQAADDQVGPGAVDLACLLGPRIAMLCALAEAVDEGLIVEEQMTEVLTMVVHAVGSGVALAIRGPQNVEVDAQSLR